MLIPAVVHLPEMRMLAIIMQALFLDFREKVNFSSTSYNSMNIKKFCRKDPKG